MRAFHRVTCICLCLFSISRKPLSQHVNQFGMGISNHSEIFRAGTQISSPPPATLVRITMLTRRQLPNIQRGRRPIEKIRAAALLPCTRIQNRKFKPASQPESVVGSHIHIEISTSFLVPYIVCPSKSVCRVRVAYTLMRT